MPSFDVVSEIDLQEMDNAINQAVKEIQTRYDFKGTKSKIEWNKKDEITLVGDDDMKLKAIIDILQSKLLKRNISLKALEMGKVEEISGGLLKKLAKIKQGIPQDEAKAIVKQIKGTKFKVQAAIQGDQLRITGKKLDDLQEVIAFLKEAKLDIELQFVNMRS